MDLTQKIKLYQDRFQVRQDVYATLIIKDGNKSYVPECKNKFPNDCHIGKIQSPCSHCSMKERAPVTQDVIAEHITGRKIHGFYLLFPDDTVRIAAMDFDEQHTLNDVKEVYSQFLDIGLKTYPATSTSKGWHIYIFFSEPINANKVRSLLISMCKKFDVHILPEIFPKQNRLSDLGSLIRTLLSEPEVKKGRCAFLYPNSIFEPILLEQQWEWLKKVERYPISKVDELLRSYGLSTAKDTNNPNRNISPKQIKPCIRNALGKGVIQGNRNQTGIMIASELKRLGNNRASVLGVMAVWNLRNNPPLSNNEVLNIINSAFTKDYDYGCRSEQVKNLIDCVGYNNCEYYRKHRTMKYMKRKHRNDEMGGK